MRTITSYVDSPLTRGQCFFHHHIDCPYQYRPLECMVNSVEIMWADKQNLVDEVFVISRITLISTLITSDITKMESNYYRFIIQVNCFEKQ